MMLDFLHLIPALVRVGMVFVVVVLLIRKQVSLGSAFLISSVLLGVLFVLPPLDIIRSMSRSLSDLKTVSLAGVVSLILVLSSSMESAGQMARMLTAFKGIVRHPKANLIIFPALIGLLPMPGGAVFSAPMVGQLGAGSDHSPARLSFINYWFRHIWEYWWPLYPGVLLTSVMADLDLAGFIAFMFPLTLLAFSAGYLMLRDSVGSAAPITAPRPGLKPFLREILPILIVILPGLGLGFGIAKLWPRFTINKETGLILALFMAIIWVWRVNHVPRAEIRKILFSTKLLHMIYMIFGILIFKGILEDSQAVHIISEELIGLHIPLVLIVVVLPLLVGLVSGITIAFVGATFPILIPLILTIEPGANLLPYMMLGIASGFAGVMLSPVHLCFILSNQYFETRMETVYSFLWFPCASLVLGGLAYFFALRLLA